MHNGILVAYTIALKERGLGGKLLIETYYDVDKQQLRSQFEVGGRVEREDREKG